MRTAIVDADGNLIEYLPQSVSFAYDATSGDMETVTDVLGRSWDYTYADPDHPHFLTARYDPLDRLIVGIEYEEGRAIREENGAGETIVALTYNVDGTTTIEYGEDGVGGSVTHQYDASNTLISQTDGAGGITETGYDYANFRPNRVVDSNNNETTMQWSDDGADLEDTWDALLNHTHTEYDGRHNPTLVTNPDDTQTLFVYNGDGSATNPLTDETVGNPVWDEDVLVLRIDNYVDGSSALDANRVTRYQYNDQSLVETVTYPDGTATRTTYTGLGRPETVTENYTDNPGGLPGENAITSYTYDDLGRVETVTDPKSRKTKYTYLDDDSLADLVTANYADGRDPYEDGVYKLSTRTYRDELGRVYATVSNYYDPTGGDLTSGDIEPWLPLGRNLVERVYFDAAGRVETTVTNFVGDDLNNAGATPPDFDPDTTPPDRNLVTRVIYDGAGRVVATVDNYTSADLSGGGAPQSVDLNGDAAGGSVTLEISPEESQYNQITRLSYDAAGRVRTTTTAAWPNQSDFYHPPSYESPFDQSTYNLVTAFEYDLAGNVTKTVTNYDPALSGGYAVALDMVPDPEQAPDTTLHIDPNTPDRNAITCAEYDALNRPYLTTTACMPGEYSDYLEIGDNLYNLVSATYYDEMGRVYATVSNYNASRDTLEANKWNFITRAYYDELGRVTHTVENFAGNIESTTLPDYNTSAPDRNLITGIFYNSRGYPYITVHNLDTATGDWPAQTEIAEGYPDRNLVTVSHYNAIGRVDWTVDNFVGNLSALPEMPPGFPAGPSDQNLLTTYTYDELGRQVKTIAVRGSETREARITYDLLGRTTRSVLNYGDDAYDPAAPDTDLITRTVYEALGRTVTTIGPTGGTSRTVADALGRITEATGDPGGVSQTMTTTTYDAAGRPVQTVTENGDEDQVTEVRYDALGRAIQTIANPDEAGGEASISTLATYDLLGRTITITDPMSIVTRSVYDNLGRLRQVFENFQGVPACNQTPNVATDTNVCTTYEYDGAGHLTSTTLGNGSTTAYEYDALGRVILETIDPGGEEIETAYAYDAAGNPVALTRDPDGTPQPVQTTYDRLGRATDIHYADPTLNVSTSYDAWGGRALMDDAVPGGVWSYEYDDMNRLTHVTNPFGQTVDYGYNGAGQRASLSLPGTDYQVAYGYDSAGRLETLTDPFAEGQVAYTYDGAGRLTGMTRTGGAATSYDYNIFGRLTGVTNANLLSFTYALDAHGNRVGAIEDLGSGSTAMQSGGMMVGDSGSLAVQNNPSLGISQPSIGQPVDLAAMLAPFDPSPVSFPKREGNDPGSFNAPFTLRMGETTEGRGGSGQSDPAPDLSPNEHPSGAVQSPITTTAGRQSPNHTIDDLLAELDAAYAAGDICNKGAYTSLRKKAENTQKSMEKANSEAAANQLKVLVKEIAAQSVFGQSTVDKSSAAQSACIAQGVADRLTFIAGVLMLEAGEPSKLHQDEEPHVPQQHEEHIPDMPPAPPVDNQPSAFSGQLPAFSYQPSATSHQLSALSTQYSALSTAFQSSLTFVVTSTGDGADSNTNDGICDDGTGACTLRAAIQQANAVAGLDTITFNIPGGGPYLIQPASSLPGIGDPVIIDGTTQPGYLLSATNPLGETTTYQYDDKHNLRFVTDPLGNTTEYQYDAKGNRTAVIDPLDHTLISAEYNQYGGPTLLSSAAGNTFTISYDPYTFMPMSASDSLGALGGYTWTDHGNPETFTDEHGGTTTYTYDDYGNVETEADPLTHTTGYTYNSYGQMETRTDPLTHTTSYEYDELGRLVMVTDAEDGITHYEYDAYGNRTAVVDALGRRTETIYDASNRVVDVTRGAHDPDLAITTHYQYDVYGRATDVTTAYGTPLASTTHTVYDAVGRRVQVTAAYGTAAASTTFYQYDDAGRLTDVTSAYGTPDASTTHTGYDDAGRQTDVTTAYGTLDASTTHYQYNDAGQLTDVTAAYGTPIAATTHYEYDVRGRLTITTYPDGSTSSQTYLTLPGGAGSVQSTRDAAGITTDSVYDLAGRLDRVVVTGLGSPAPQQVTHYEYDDAGRQTAVIDPMGSRTSFTYDDVGRMLTTTQWLDELTGYTSSTVYNDAGQIETSIDANSRVTSYSYDPLGRLLSTSYPGGVSTSQTYDAAGRRETATDENGAVTRYSYDPAGRLESVTLADGTPDASTTAYAYNAAGQIVSITDALNRITSFQYDHAGRQSTKVWPDSSTEVFGYDALGNQTSHQLADGHTNTFSYDPMGRLLGISYFDGQSAAFTYAADGQRETASTQSGPLAAPQTTTYSYDTFRRPERVTSPDGRAVSYDYDDANRRTGLTTWLNNTTQAGSATYGYNALGQLESADDGHGVTSFTYDPVGMLTEKALPNGVTTDYDYNLRYQLTGVTHSNTGGVLQSFTYTLDDAGNRLGVTEGTGNSIAWQYDDAYRLTAERRYDPAHALIDEATFTYDDMGNRLTETTAAGTTTYSYNDLDQLIATSGPEGDVAYGYDGRGNLDQITKGIEVTDFTFDAADRLAGVVMPDTTQVAFAYDADGQRVSQSVDGQSVNYLWDAYSTYGDVVLETDGSGAPLAAYTLANGQLIAQTRGGVPTYYLSDGQGSTRALADATGAITDTYDYTAFGELYVQTGATENSYLYTGQQFDEATGLYDLRARYYAPGLGRFLSQDTAGVLFSNPVELNRYVYTGNNPVNRIDPSGLMFVEVVHHYQEQLKTIIASESISATAKLAYARVVLSLYRCCWRTLVGWFLRRTDVG